MEKGGVQFFFFPSSEKIDNFLTIIRQTAPSRKHA